MSIIEQLTDIYLNEENWYAQAKMPKEEADKYHQKLFDLGNIVTVLDGDLLCGYVEYWRLTFEQFGRIVCGEHFSAYHEDVQGGYLAYVANTYIRPAYRNGQTYKLLKYGFFRANDQATHFCGTAVRKKAGLIKVFKAADIKTNKEVLNGKREDYSI